MTDIDHRRSDRPPVPEPTAPQGEHPGSPFGLIALAGLVVLAGVTGGWPLLLMISAIVVMIFLHELGHYLTAKWAGMKVTEFFIGFGPRIWSFRRGETEYGIKPIPLGAYVKIVGMHNLDEYDPADADRTYMSKPFWRRVSVAIAGSTMHFVLALVALFVAHAFVGLEGGRVVLTEAEADAVTASAPWSVAAVTTDSAADDAGIEVGDRITAVDGTAIESFGEFSNVVQARPDETVPIVVQRDGERRTMDVTIGRREDDPDRGFFGVGPEIDSSTVGVVDSLEETGETFVAAIGETFSGLGRLLSPSGLADLGRAAFSTEDTPAVDDGEGASGGERNAEPQAIGLIGITDGGAFLLESGEWGTWLLLFAFINVFIGVFNLLPLLPLDGGHLAIAVYEKVRSIGRRGEPYHVDAMKLLPITYGVVLVLAFLGVSLVVLDTRSIVGG